MKIITKELEIKTSVEEAWEVYSTLKIAMIIRSEFARIFDVKILEGDGGIGTLIQVTPHHHGVSEVIRAYTERVTKIDQEKRVKEVEMIEGGYLELGFSSYRMMFELTEKEKHEEESSCIVRVTIEYEYSNEEDFAIADVTMKPLINVLEVVNQCIVQKTNKT